MNDTVQKAIDAAAAQLGTDSVRIEEVSSLPLALLQQEYTAS